MKPNSSSHWALQGTSATFAVDQWDGSVDLNAPSQGLRLRFRKADYVSGLFGVDFDRPHQPFEKDCYVRQGDLIVVYPQRDSRNFSLQLDYRLLTTNSDHLLVELWISIQTYHLDSHPVVTLGCQADANSIHVSSKEEHGEMPANSPSIVQGTTARQLIWTLMIHPRDQADTTWQWNAQHDRYEASLFGHFMEKGVIRRARMRCLIGPSSMAQADIDAAYDSFAGSALPLTT